MKPINVTLREVGDAGERVATVTAPCGCVLELEVNIFNHCAEADRLLLESGGEAAAAHVRQAAAQLGLVVGVGRAGR